MTIAAGPSDSQTASGPQVFLSYMRMWIGNPGRSACGSISQSVFARLDWQHSRGDHTVAGSILRHLYMSECGYIAQSYLMTESDALQLPDPLFLVHHCNYGHQFLYLRRVIFLVPLESFISIFWPSSMVRASVVRLFFLGDTLLFVCGLVVVDVSCTVGPPSGIATRSNMLLAEAGTAYIGRPSFGPFTGRLGGYPTSWRYCICLSLMNMFFGVPCGPASLAFFGSPDGRLSSSSKDGSITKLTCGPDALFPPSV